MKLLLFIFVGVLICATVKTSEPSSIIRELMKADVLDIFQGFQCLVGVIGKVSNENGLSELWLKWEPVVNYHLEKWQQCPQAGDKLAVVLCNIREGTLVIQVLQEYLQLVAAQNPQAVKLIALEYYNSCSSVGSIDRFLPQISNEKEIVFIDMI